MLVIIDNYDSFTYNIVQTIAANALAEPDRLLISPGPCTPKEAGISIEAIRFFAGKLPILGVCLGHQAIGEAFGGTVLRARRIMHGKTSPMFHDGIGVFSGLPSPFDGMRYHSLVVEESDLPDCLAVTCRSDEGELMGLRHCQLAIEGVQFHPESIMTPAGIQLLKNFMGPDYLKMLRP